MTNVKTAISVQQSLFDLADELARKMNVSRSRLFALALEDYIRRQENRELLVQINAAYSDEPDEEEAALSRHYQRQHRRLVDREW